MPTLTVFAQLCANARSSRFDGYTFWVPWDTQGCISSQKEILKSISLYNGKTVGGQASSFPLHSGTEIIQMEAHWSQVVEHLLKESLITSSLRAK